MSDGQPSPMEEKLAFQLKALMVGRVIVITLFLGSLLFFQHRFGNFPSPVYISWLIAATYFLTLLYALLLPYVSNLRRFVIAQILMDLGIEVGIVSTTGGIESPFSFLFLLSIISASILIHRTGGYLIASIATVLYGLVANLEFYHLIDFLEFPQREGSLQAGEYFLYTLFLNGSAFFLVAFLSGHLAEGLRKTGRELEEKNAAWEELQVFHEHIVRNMDSGLFTTDLVGRITSYNEAAGQITGYSFEEVQGVVCSRFFDFLLLFDLFRNPLDPELPSEVPRHHEGPFLHKVGRELHLSINLSLLKDEKRQVKGVIGVFHDLTERKTMEEQVRRADKLAAVGGMAAGLAHEIRNPLASISGSIQLLKTELPLEGTHQRLMNIVITEIERLDRLITDFLDYARPHPPFFQSCDIHQLLEETLLLLENSREPHPPLEIIRSFEAKDIPVLVDSNQMKQVLWNLYMNALDSMPSGGVLNLSTRLLARQELPRRRVLPRFEEMEGAGQNLVEITLSDTGAGIPKQDKTRIFDPFYTAKEKGNGLGLAIVHRIIEKHGGLIEVESELGKGSIFKIYLPAELKAEG